MKKNSAFSLIELSIVILIIGILIAGVTQSSRLVKQFKIKTAQTLTQSSPVSGIKNLLLWYETSMESSFDVSETADGVDVTTWYDINPQSVNKINAVATSKPVYTDSAISGLPVLRFNGTNDAMPFDGSSLANSDYTIFVVEQRRNGSGTYRPMLGGTTNSTNQNLHLIYYLDTTVRFAHYGAGTLLDQTVAAYSSPIARIHTARFGQTSGVGKSYWLNGGATADQVDTAQVTPISSWTGSAIGRANFAAANVFFDGDIAEVIIFTRALKTEERQSVESYLSKKYSITIS